MNTTQFPKHSSLHLSLVVVLLAFIGLGYLITLPATPKSLPTSEPVTTYQPSEITLSGTYICLPSKNPLPPNETCTYGLKTDEGDYYVLDFNVINPALVLGDRFTAPGTFTPIEMLSSNHIRDNFDVLGIFSVKPPIKKL